MLFAFRAEGRQYTSLAEGPGTGESLVSRAEGPTYSPATTGLLGTGDQRGNRSPCSLSYNAASAVASSGDIVEYFATPTMVNTLLKCGVSPKIPIVRSPDLLASNSI
jgi:hypothetical protein